ncbi:protoporphyrinogen oxidase HemJ [bacterium (Candidatus Blackallbacteria) CG17_big_fil_post_rev_8_21_14_2_50_48_46]|uniref:Protoporphyrinogen IX oxidase n=1 Tax=bacterium (Candidatus Blackallbacteria) CG17_big_fil_post_rev_8_21_14_2_50_48_46 TaxID=2014261 RepID=A0A2M7G8M2_9BACT|nr:MAG: TIGR00701 family protein [bacterium (Candidatus Blackallbacteria) CG18_big_fil_WC_8_21_14_2_50_49_26]PIW18447.1 MAG: protoporphyrinogen oxidase HemJ [bacterium (Candidatus Blackallbacteria) CG17_big_fil_post_rev_8_21_14_2_50_48_46]PIW46568.1 MAG: protoporphyrinogen oxidase HemJ [bacterium (Candidatus Blackallbacteria) CG13_big_fil_rev_8_21_14_2_50_49_14]
MSQLYLWLKALHLIAVVAWFAGLFYIFRLYVYHIEASSDEVKKTLEVMERKLLRIIMNPAMIAVLLLGSGLIAVRWPEIMKSGWFHAKLLFVTLLFGYHHYAGVVRKQLAAGTCKLTSKQARLINEIPTLCLFVIIILVVIKPF